MTPRSFKNEQTKNGNAIKCNRGSTPTTDFMRILRIQVGHVKFETFIRYKARYEDRCSVGYSTGVQERRY